MNLVSNGMHIVNWSDLVTENVLVKNTVYQLISCVFILVTYIIPLHKLQLPKIAKSTLKLFEKQSIINLLHEIHFYTHASHCYKIKNSKQLVVANKWWRYCQEGYKWNDVHTVWIYFYTQFSTIHKLRPKPKLDYTMWKSMGNSQPRRGGLL